MTALLLLLTGPRASRADGSAEKDHRLAFGGGYAPLSYASSQNVDDEARRNKNPTGHVRVGYTYRAVRGLEVGGAVTTAFTGFGALLMPAGSLGGFVTFGEQTAVELGTAVRLGALMAPSRMDLGWSLSAGPEVRVWPTPSVGFVLGGSASLAKASSNGGTRSLAYLTLGTIDLAVAVAL